MSRKLLSVLLIALLLILAGVVRADYTTNYQLQPAVISSGGSVSTSGHSLLVGTLGQPITGRSTSSTYTLCYGFRCEAAARPVRVGHRPIFLPLIVRNYDPNRDPYEIDDTFDQAQSIAADGSLQHRNFYPGGDVDWVQLAVSPGTTLIATGGLRGNTYPDTVLALYASNGVTQLALNDDCAPTTRASCLSWTATVSTTLYLKVWPYDPASVGPDAWYDLAVVKP
jgi:hypothetical protein